MNAAEYSIHARPSVNHQDNSFRWPHTNNVTERALYNQYIQEKLATSSPRVDFNRYAENNRYQHEPYNRHDGVFHEEQQRMHDFHLKQFQQNNISDIRPPAYPYLVPGISKPSPMSDMRLAHHRMNENSPLSHSAKIAHGTSVPPLLNVIPPPPLCSASPLNVIPPPLLCSAPPLMNPSVDQSLKTVCNERVAGLAERISPPNAQSVKQIQKTESSELQLEHVSPEQYSNLQVSTETNQTGVSNESAEGYIQQNNLSIIKHKEEIKKEDKKEVAEKNPEKKSPGDSSSSSSPDNGLPSYTAMIAQAILKKEGNKSTLSDIYEYMEKYFPSLEKRGTGWRNCVRHTLSLNDCFIKLHRPENGRSCNWAVHPSYFESFSRGDYRKRRALRKRPRGLQWIDPIMLGGYPFAREHDVHPDIEQQQSPFYHYPPPAPTMWNNQQTGYNNPNQPSPPSHLQHFPPPPSHQAINPSYPTPHHAHIPNVHCANSDCYCQFNKNNYRGVYTP